jgi:hypothetical protein
MLHLIRLALKQGQYLIDESLDEDAADADACCNGALRAGILVVSCHDPLARGQRSRYSTEDSSKVRPWQGNFRCRKSGACCGARVSCLCLYTRR